MGEVLIPPLLETKAEANLQRVKQMNVSIPKLTYVTSPGRHDLSSNHYVITYIYQDTKPPRDIIIKIIKFHILKSMFYLSRKLTTDTLNNIII